MDAESPRYIDGLLRLLGVLAALTVPVVVWAMVRFRRAGPAVESGTVKLPGGAYRGGSARSLRGQALPWTVYAALLASGMGAAFVAAVLVQAAYTGSSRVLLSSGSMLEIVAAVGCIAARFALFLAALAVFRWRQDAGNRVQSALVITGIAMLPYGACVFFERLQAASWRLELLDAGLYAGGLLATAVLVYAARRAMQKLFEGAARAQGQASAGASQQAPQPAPAKNASAV